MKFTVSALLSLLLAAPLSMVHAEDQPPDNSPIVTETGGLGPRPPKTPPSGFGDPHFSTYDGTKYSFHGQCDLVMARSVSFDDGLGLEVHARTEIVTDWSLIKNAAVRIGNDTFELANDGAHYFNGEKNVYLREHLLADKYRVTKNQIMVQITKDDIIVEEPKLVFTIDLGSKKSIKMSLWKHMISVQVGIHLDDTEGMLGIYGKEGLIGRDRETPALGANDMGFQWQVQDTEPMLFHDVQIPQFPQQCILPAVDTRNRRLESATDDFIKLANEACANVDSDMRAFCIDDVLLTRDVHVANAYGDSDGFGF